MSEVRKAFCAALASLCDPDNREEATIALRAMLPMLSDLPEYAFHSRDCLSDVATAKRRTKTPDYATIRAAIAQWVRDNPDPMPRITEPAKKDWEQMDHLWLKFWHTRKAEGFLRTDLPGMDREVARRNLLHMVGEQAPLVHAYLLENGLAGDGRGVILRGEAQP